MHAETAAIIERVKSRLGVLVSAAIVPPGVIERSAGKARRVIDWREL